MEWVIIAGAIAALWLFGLLVQVVNKAKLYDQNKPRFDSIAAKEADLVAKAGEIERLRVQAQQEFAAQQAQLVAKVEADRNRIQMLALQKSEGFPWLARAYADYFHLQDMQTVTELRTKKHPAKKTAERVKEIAAERRKAERLWRTYRYQLLFYEKLVPWLTELREIGDDDLLIVGQDTPNLQPARAANTDPAQHYLSPGEYEQLSREDKFQRALDRYWQTRKTKWQIGRDYERYVGYLFEAAGWEVTYHGIAKGLEDLGRDLLVQKGERIRVVQCKCWSAQKRIHEKHVFQLFGTTIEFWLRQEGLKTSDQSLLFEQTLTHNPIKPVLFTSTSLSEPARAFARVLGVDIHENVPFQRYPCIKCNYTKEHGKIYHLPFDQQYDRTKIQDPRTERFVETVAEAEALGYRRAYRWRGERHEK